MAFHLTLNPYLHWYLPAQTIDNMYQKLIALLLLLAIAFLPGLLPAQNLNCNATTLAEFYDCYGGETAFSLQSRQATAAFIQAEDALVAEDYALAKRLIDDVFTRYPKGNNVWGSVFNDVNGSNLGTPHAYYGLRMMEEIADYHLNADDDTERGKIFMKVVLIGCAEGVQPTTEEELLAGTGPVVTNSLDPAVQADDYRIIHQSMDLFKRYVVAITKGELELDIEVIELPDLCLPVDVSTSRPHVASGAIAPIWDILPEEMQKNTDWWWVMYPSHVPDAPTFDDEAFITGGMGRSPRGGPVFIVDDLWIVRKPPHLGKGLYSDIERRIYLPQWLQHEIYHHFYQLYPELQLEVNGHDWFNLSFWPDDFEGLFEPDYYAETLKKRMQTDCRTLATKLVTRENGLAAPELVKLSIDELLDGEFSIDNVTNGFHTASILQRGDRFFWRNVSNVEWEVFPMLADGRLTTGADSPYPGEDFFVELYKTVDGKLLPAITALKFQGEFYKKRFGFLRTQYPFEISLGNYTRMPEETTQHTGNIIKEAGNLFWANDAGDRWALNPEVAEESFSLGGDSPTPGEDFKLILVEGECSLNSLGFQYGNDFYWRDKMDPLNGSPILVNPIADQELMEDFDPLSFDLSTVFTDPEGEAILLFVSSSNPDLVSATIENNQLVLSGAETGNVIIRVFGLDVNGGVVMDEFLVDVGNTVSTGEVEGDFSLIRMSPNPMSDEVTLSGELSNYTFSLHSPDGRWLQALPANGQQATFNLSHFPKGVYLIRITHRVQGWDRVKKVIKR